MEKIAGKRGCEPPYHGSKIFKQDSNQESNHRKAKEVLAERARRDDNICKLDEIVNNGDTKRTKQEPWNVIIARTCEVYNSVDGNILCPACMNVTPNIFTLCLHCRGRFYSCGIRNTVSTSTVAEVDDDRRKTMSRWSKWVILTKMNKKSSTRRRWTRSRVHCNLTSYLTTMKKRRSAKSASRSL